MDSDSVASGFMAALRGTPQSLRLETVFSCEQIKLNELYAKKYKTKRTP
jgi:hypothetical protein